MDIDVADATAQFAIMDYDKDGTVELVEFINWVGTCRYCVKLRALYTHLHHECAR